MGALVAGIGVIRSEAGLRWALAQVPGLSFQALEGAAFDRQVRIGRLHWQSALQGGPSVTVESLVLQAPRWRWRPYPGAWIGLAAEAASAARVSVSTGGPSDTPLSLPASLRLPAELKIDALRVDELQVDGQSPLKSLRAGIHLGAEVGARHEVKQLQLATSRALFDGVQVRLAADPPFALQATVGARSAPKASRAWRADATATGPLADLQAEATLRGAAVAGRGEPRLDAKARLAPMERWPLKAMTLATQDLDLADLADGAPRTRLAGRAEVELVGLDRPARIEARLSNAAPGRWDAGQLPVTQLALKAQATPSTLREVVIEQFDVRLADGARPAGQLKGRGRWTAEALALDTELDALQPALLHARAPALRLAGPLKGAWIGLPGPAALGGGDTGARARAPAWSARLEGRLQGQATAAGLPQRPVSTSFKAEFAAGRLQIDDAVLRDGVAQARASLGAQRQGDRWQLQAQGDLAAFDPSPWWPAAAELARRGGGAHRLAGDITLQASLPAAAPPGDALAWLRAWRGDLTLKLSDSLVAGQPLAGSAALHGDAQAVTLKAQAQAGDNQLALEGNLSLDPARDAWQLKAQWPRLAALLPWARLQPALGQAWPTAGEAEASFSVRGRWPLLRSDGQARLRGLRLPDAQLERADLRWRLGTDAAAPWELQLDATGLRRDELRLDHLSAKLDGTRDAHRIELRADSPARPPAWSESLLGRTAGGSRVQLQAQGAWQPDASASTTGGLWQAQAMQLRLAARDGGAPWFAAQDLSARLRLDPHGAVQRVQVAPGRAVLPGGAAMRWSALDWQAGERAASDRLQVKAELETLTLAPWLARLQPGLGWAGDLRVGATLDITADQRFAADIVLERHGGDLRITDELGVAQSLGLTDLRVAMVARDGLWQFTQAAAGARLGEMAGAQVLRTTPERRWPAADTPMEGVLEMRVANLGAWGAWVPPGWRLGGNLRVSAGLGGRFGAPELRGELVGRELAVRNLLQGVNLTEGELQASLDGERVKVERFAFRGGDGTLTLTGGGTLGAAPGARLELVADNFRLLGRIDRRLTASGRAALDLTRDSLRLDGQVDIDDGLFDFSRADAPTLDADVQVRGAADSANGTGAAEANGTRSAAMPTALRNARVDLRIGLGDKLEVRGRGLDTRLRGDLRLSSPQGRLALHGTVRAVDGTYVAYGQKMEIDRGELVFSGNADNPRLDIRAVRPNLDVTVGVAVTGSAQIPRVKLFSQPDMADFDKLSWLVLGRAPDGLGRTDTALLQRAAVALLAGEGEAPTDQLMKTLGITDFSLRQTDGEVRETVVSLGKQLSRRWYLGYERSVNATTGTWQLVYRIAQRFTLRAQSGEDNALDLIWSWRW
jgi:translocation and assembly module TamB